MTEAKILSDRDQHKTLEDDKIPLRTAALEQIEKDRQWKHRTDIRVEVPSFQRVSVKSDDLNSPTSAAVNQNGYPKKTVLVDIIATCSWSPTTTCVAIINLAPQTANWVFSKPYPRNRFFAATTISPRIPQANGNSPPVRMKEYGLALDAKMYDKGTSFQNDDKERRCPNNLLADTSMQTLEGTYSLVEHLPPSIPLHGKDKQFFVPIMMSNADIFSDEHIQNYAIYCCPVPPQVKFPGYAEDVNEPVPEAARWPVLVTKPEGLEDLLDRLREMPATRKLKD